MSLKERRRLELLARVRDQQLRLVQAARMMQLSYRQAKRIWKRFRQLGDAGLVHRLRGRPSGRGVPAAHRQRIVQRYDQDYHGFGPTLAAEHLAREGLALDHETLRRWLLAAGLWQKRRARAVHRQRRERKPQLGEMVQMDGSPHDWFEGRRAPAVLMVMIDDATNHTYARFFEQETTEAAFESFHRYSRQHGLPLSLYVDRDSIYRTDRQPTLEEQLAGQEPVTQFGRAMKQLAVELIPAHSPQAKGRVERENGVLQDRLIKEMRLLGLGDLESANEFLEESFLPALNAKFSRVATKQGDLHRPVTAVLKLEEVLSVQEQRVVSADWTVRWGGRYFQLTIENRALRLVGKSITVYQRFDGRLQLKYRSQELVWRELPGPVPRKCPPATLKSAPRRSWKPAGNHPWRLGARAGAKRSAARRGLAPACLPNDNNKNNNNGNNNKNGSRQKGEKGTFLTSQGRGHS